jgi:hypothetical protein
MFVVPQTSGSGSGYTAFRREFLQLTGATPLLPDFAFGTWFTWWHNYTQAEAEREVVRWATDRIPLDIWGLDMNWRDNCSLSPKPGGGYEWKDDCMNETQVTRDHFYNSTTSLFPNMTGFVEWEHSRGIKSFFNDHPFPVGAQTSPEEVAFRWDGMSSVMRDIGIDWWWLDTNVSSPRRVVSPDREPHDRRVRARVRVRVRVRVPARLRALCSRGRLSLWLGGLLFGVSGGSQYLVFLVWTISCGEGTCTPPSKRAGTKRAGATTSVGWCSTWLPPHTLPTTGFRCGGRGTTSQWRTRCRVWSTWG